MWDNSYFLSEMRDILSENDYQKFVLSLNEPMYKALRINTLKTDHKFLSK